MQQIILIRITGDDKPGLTATLAKQLEGSRVDILDIGQAVIHDTLSLGILIRIPRESESAPIVKDLLFTAHELGVNLTFTPIPPERYERWVEAQGKARHIVTLLARTITAEQVAAISRVIAENGLNIDVITRLSGRAALDASVATRQACVEFSVRGTPPDPAGIKGQFLAIAAKLGVDIAFQEDGAFRRNRRLVAFDMDSTLIAAEVIDELAKEAGVGRDVAAITESAMRGEIDFKQSLRKRLSLLRGLPATTLDAVAERIPMTDGAERLITNLKRFGYKIAIISGGFTYFGRRLQERLGIDFLFANELEITDGQLTGNVVGDIVDAAKKAEILTGLAAREGLSLQQVIAVGDGANDLPMLNLAGLGIAFHAKPVVKQGAKQAISTLGLDSILYLIGMRDRDTVT
ncbi:phosphoserine phosphatase SerB [Desulfolutivibrio sulfoxidireducens]|uniref:phosphoserine phosphatase SerB n=1 Tax=Desulfolutivibrio sulfoxidireducens TaxID=2773299 RepID=UPI00159D7BCA|nr:phosphoserine phosphatase SerB [Desulfolutivibrio sulfoxidireducens]QLA17101.1 phosphoserine phosphatase SerB [Desulfolutivibrio sulfoxidireducens]QLA20668.1 phosphoserine phosphatase SerB [Desulfolutivibrio sulfoxidireducens]